MFDRLVALSLAMTCLLMAPGLAVGQEESPTTATEAEDTTQENPLAHLPNLVLIIADDMGWDDSSPYGHESIMTPHLAQMAADGMRFDNAFVTASSCSPSRASIITGRYPHQTDAEQLHWHVPANQTTFVELLKEKGYWTAAAGKWHLGPHLRNRFDEIRDAANSEEPTTGAADWVPLLHYRPTDRPFFLWLAALDPHRPYEDAAVEDPAQPEEVKLPPYHPDTPAVRADYQKYYDEITRLDNRVGRFLDALDQLQLTSNTLVLFISDNGRPFPRDKTTLYDSGIKTPWIARWPAQITPGTSTPKLVSTVDIAKTFLKLAEINHPGPTFGGVDFSALFKAPQSAIRDYIHAEKHWHDFEDHSRAIRNERYKYIRNDFPDLPLTPPLDALTSPTYIELVRLKARNELNDAQLSQFQEKRPAEELYDVKEDPFELNNLAADERYAPVLTAMKAALEDWAAKTADQVPSSRTPDGYDRVTGQPAEGLTSPRPSKEEMIKQGLLTY